MKIDPDAFARGVRDTLTLGPLRRWLRKLDADRTVIVTADVFLGGWSAQQAAAKAARDAAVSAQGRYREALKERDSHREP